MTREFLNPQMLTDFGWDSLHATDSVAMLVKRNIPEMDTEQAKELRISFDSP